MSKLLSRDDILQASDLPMERVEVPEWGGYVYVRTLTGAERDEYESSMLIVRGSGRGAQAQVNMANARARLCALAICDTDGSRLFSTEDVRALGQKSAAALDRIYSVAMRLSGLRPEDIEELTKNSPGAPNGDSGSDSR